MTGATGRWLRSPCGGETGRFTVRARRRFSFRVFGGGIRERTGRLIVPAADPFLARAAQTRFCKWVITLNALD